MSDEREKLKSVGKCIFCGKEFAKAGISRHLTSCKARQAKNEEVAVGSKGKPVPLYHLAILGTYANMYWMHLEMPASAKLGTLDQFLRDMWLECCGHLSQFIVGNIHYSVMPNDDADFGYFGFAARFEEKSMNFALSKAVKPGDTFHHEYDFGTTTDLTLKVMAEHIGVPHTKDIFIMSRSEAPAITCEICKQKPATHICSDCYYDEPNWFCADCAKKASEEDGDKYFLPVVNSPRVGQCGYTGDVEWEQDF